MCQVREAAAEVAVGVVNAAVVGLCVCEARF